MCWLAFLAGGAALLGVQAFALLVAYWLFRWGILRTDEET